MFLVIMYKQVRRKAGAGDLRNQVHVFLVSRANEATTMRLSPTRERSNSGQINTRNQAAWSNIRFRNAVQQ